MPLLIEKLDIKKNPSGARLLLAELHCYLYDRRHKTTGQCKHKTEVYSIQ
jgi:hypothetical protein